jgi:hypothetical protein
MILPVVLAGIAISGTAAFLIGLLYIAGFIQILCTKQVESEREAEKQDEKTGHNKSLRLTLLI